MLGISSRVLLWVFALAGFLNGIETVGGREVAGPKRPNILFIYTDDQSWRTLSCYNGRPWARTPNIDRLADEGVRFTYAYAAAWCVPSRASVMTGLLPHGIRGLYFKGIIKGRYDPAICRFWPAELRKADYRTIMIGKWHIGPDSGHGRDWDHSVVWDQADIRGDWYNDQLISIDGAPKKVVPGYSTDLYTRFAVEEIKRDHDRPWFMWLCYNAPHLPNTVHPRHKSRYKQAEVPIPSDVFGPRPGKPAYMNMFTMWHRDNETPGKITAGKRGPTLPEYVRAYNRLVCAVDEGVGQIYDALARTGQLDQTLIVFTSDQGFALGEHGFNWKVGPYEECMRMPLIVRMPGLAVKGGVCDRPVALVDLPPTFFALAGLPLPWKMHGHDLQPLLKNPRADWDHPVLLEHFLWLFGPQTDRALTEKSLTGGVPWWIFLRWERYKYICTLVPDEIEELYDLKEDPSEMRNLALEADSRPLLIEYRDRMIKELTRTEAGLLKNLPAPRRAR
ncbi:MAG: sulfatase-like hydrolase/transferase [Planctomycetota bacterium]|jgi:arylsulfatase A-like enzyme